jgi:GNAT superfamily N-acetyltransferase
MDFLDNECTFCEFTKDILNKSNTFSCGNTDLDDFFAKDAIRYAYYLMGKSYCFLLDKDPSQIICAFTVSNDSIRVYDLPRSRRDYMKSLTHHEKPLRRYPGVLIGRLGVNKDYTGRGIGSEALSFIKYWFLSSSNKTGCRFIIVDAVNEEKVIKFYNKNGFIPLFTTEEQEFLYTGGKKGSPILLNTRLMYYDLLTMR